MVFAVRLLQILWIELRDLLPMINFRPLVKVWLCVLIQHFVCFCWGDHFPSSFSSFVSYIDWFSVSGQYGNTKAVVMCGTPCDTRYYWAHLTHHTNGLLGVCLCFLATLSCHFLNLFLWLVLVFRWYWPCKSEFGRLSSLPYSWDCVSQLMSAP